MAEIPLDKDYLRKHYPDKYKELEKNKASSHTSQSKNKSTQKQPKPPSIQDEGMKLFTDEINKVLKGDIKRPTEFDKFISENPKSFDELVLSQTAWLAKTSAYIAMHLKRWVEENPKKEHVVEDWYRIVSNPFTNRLVTIKIPCEDLLDILSARLPNFQQRFKEKYEQLLSVAKKADEDKAHTLGRGINNFKKAAISLHGTTLTIHSEALVMLNKLTKLASSSNSIKPAEKDRESKNGEKAERSVLTMPVRSSNEKTKRLYEIANALVECGKYDEKHTNKAEWDTPAAKQLVRKAMKLLVNNLALLNECKSKYGCHNPLQEYFGCIEQAASLPRTKDFGDYSYWVCNFCKPRLWGGVKRSFVDECMRYANEIGMKTEQDSRNSGDTYNIKAEHVSLGDKAKHASRDNISTQETEQEKGRWGWIKKISLILTIIVSLIVIVGAFNKYIRKDKPAVEQIKTTNLSGNSVDVNNVVFETRPTADAIIEEIERLPVFEQKVAAENYIGRTFKWRLRFDFLVHEKGGMVYVLCKASPVRGEVSFNINADTKENLKIKKTKKGKFLDVSGEIMGISFAREPQIRLKDVRLEFVD